MIDKTVFDKGIDQLQQMADKYDSNVLKDACQRIVEVRDSFEMKVLFVGKGHPGKSALINELIGQGEYLKEGHGTSKVCELRASDIGMSNLKSLSDYTIVDTPGLDSLKSDRTCELPACLGEGGAYIVVIDITKGDVDPTILRYIDVASGYTSNIAIVLNQCDKIGETSRKDILEKIRDTLDAHGYTFPVYCLSRHDSDVAERLTAIIRSFNGNDAFRHRMQMAFHAERDIILSALRLALRHADRGTWRYDVQIQELRSMKDRVQRAFDRECSAVEDALPQKVDVVMADIQSALESRADVCADLILAQDGNALEATMLSAVRPVILRHVREVASSKVDAIVHNLNFSSVMEGCTQKDLVDSVVSTLTSTRELIDSGALGQALSVLNKEQSAAKAKSDEANRMYKAVTGTTAILTNVINPWAEVVIVLLPEIVGICKALFGASEHEIARDRYLKRVTSVVSAKLYLPVETALRNATEALVRGLEQKCADGINALEKEMARLESDRTGSLDGDDKRRVSLEKDIKLISKMQQLEVVG